MAKQKDKEADDEEKIITKIKEKLENNEPIKNIEYTANEKNMIKQISILTAKPMLYVANVAEDEVSNHEDNEYVKQNKEYADNEGSKVIVISAKIEEERATLDDEDRKMFLEDLGVE